MLTDTRDEAGMHRPYDAIGMQKRSTWSHALTHITLVHGTKPCIILCSNLSGLTMSPFF